MATGDVRDRSFSLKFRNLKFGVHCNILYTSIKSVSLFPPRSNSSIERHESRIELMIRKFFGLENRFMFWPPSETQGGNIRFVPAVGSSDINIKSIRPVRKRKLLVS